MREQIRLGLCVATTIFVVIFPCATSAHAGVQVIPDEYVRTVCKSSAVGATTIKTCDKQYAKADGRLKHVVNTTMSHSVSNGSLYVATQNRYVSSGFSGNGTTVTVTDSRCSSASTSTRAYGVILQSALFPSPYSC